MNKDKHVTCDARLTIAKLLKSGSSFNALGRMTGKDHGVDLTGGACWRSGGSKLLPDPFRSTSTGSMRPW